METKRVLIGNFAETILKASRARVSDKPVISNIIFSGCTGNTQYSTLPFPVPIRLSGALKVTGLSGKMMQPIPDHIQASSFTLSTAMVRFDENA